MKLIAIILPLSFMIFISCKTSKTATETTIAPEKHPAETAVSKTDATNEKNEVVNIADPNSIATLPVVYRLIISSISIGEGPDKNGKEILDAFISDWTTKYKIHVAYESVHWGREGETDFCFLLSELDQPQQKQFIAEFRKKYEGHSLIQFTENEPCIHKR